jgi:hypothetical protein
MVFSKKSLFTSAFFLLVLCPGTLISQTQERPLTSQEIVSLVYQLPRHPEKRDEIVELIRRRGIGFPLTDGMRALVATKSGNDALLRRTLEEAERRRVNPTESKLPPLTEANETLERTRNVTLAAANAMPDFLVKQLIRRYVAYGNTTNWVSQDNLAIAVGFRANAGEEYKLLSINGVPAPDEVKPTRDYNRYVKGATSSGVEYISALADIFKPETKTEFQLVDTDVVRDRRALVFEYVVKRELSKLSLGVGNASEGTIVGSRGRVWIDRELDRVIRFEQIATEIPPGFPISAATSLIDYDWVMIGERKYLLPTHSEILMTSNQAGVVLQSRNDVRFRSYQKFGAELKVIDEIGEDDEPTDPPAPPPKPTPPVKKP